MGICNLKIYNTRIWTIICPDWKNRIAPGIVVVYRLIEIPVAVEIPLVKRDTIARIGVVTSGCVERDINRVLECLNRIPSYHTDVAYRRDVIGTASDLKIVAEKCSKRCVRMRNSGRVVRVVKILIFCDYPEMVIIRCIQRLRGRLDMPRGIIVPADSCICIKVKFLDRIEHRRFDLHKIWLMFPRVKVDVENEVAARPVHRVVPDIRSHRNRRCDRFRNVYRIKRSCRSLVFPAYRHSITEHNPDSAWRQWKFDLHFPSDTVFENSVPVVVSGQVRPEIVVASKVF